VIKSDAARLEIFLRSPYGCMKATEVKRLKELEQENTRY
jgi:hypothetical protein